MIDNITNADILVAACGIALFMAVVYGFIRRVKRGDAPTNTIDILVDEIKNIVGREIADILHNAGIAADYDSFKDYVIKQLLKKARKYFDEKGGTLDQITDVISDEDIISAINAVIKMSDIENEIKDAFDQLVNNRLKEIEESDAEVEAENEKIETEDLSKYEEEVDVEEEPEVKVDEE